LISNENMPHFSMQKSIQTYKKGDKKILDVQIWRFLGASLLRSLLPCLVVLQQFPVVTPC
jgi:hypothetical protein